MEMQRRGWPANGSFRLSGYNPVKGSGTADLARTSQKQFDQFTLSLYLSLRKNALSLRFRGIQSDAGSISCFLQRAPLEQGRRQPRLCDSESIAPA
jgi:hypothetical protein